MSDCATIMKGRRSSPTYSNSERDHQGHDRENLADLHSGGLSDANQCCAEVQM